MRPGYYLLLAAATVLLSSNAASATTTGQWKTAVLAGSFSSGENVVADKRALRTRDAGDEDATEKTDEERWLFGDGVPSVKKIMDTLDFTEEAATIIRSIAKGHSPEKTLTKMGVKPSFITNGQKVYSKYDPGYRKYLDWVKWMQSRGYYP